MGTRMGHWEECPQSVQWLLKTLSNLTRYRTQVLYSQNILSSHTKTPDCEYKTLSEILQIRGHVSKLLWKNLK